MSAALSAVLVTLLLSSCSSTTTKAEVCSAFDELARAAMVGNVFGNQVFDAMDDLASVADRYTGSPTLKSDAAQLAEISESGSTSMLELESATTGVASLCGHSLTEGALGQ